MIGLTHCPHLPDLLSDRQERDFDSSVIWYLSGARDRDRTAFGVPDWSTYLSNANNLPEAIDTSDSETESIGSVIEE